jgi:hypothetical protein
MMKFTSSYGFEPLTAEDFDIDIEANSPSIPKSLLGRCFTRTQEVIELEDIPPIIKSVCAAREEPVKAF